MSTSEADKKIGVVSAAQRHPVVDRWVAFVTYAYIPLLLLAITLGYFSFDIAKGLKLNANITSLMPSGVPSVDNLQKVIKKTGGYSNSMILVESPDPDAALRFVQDLRAEVLKTDWAASAEYAEDTAIFERNKLIYVDQTDLREMDRRLAERLDYEKKHLKFSVDETPVEIEIRGAADTRPPLEFDDIKQKYEGGKADSKKSKIFRNEAGDLTILVVFPKGGTTNVNYARGIIRELEGLVEKLNPTSYHPEMMVVLGGRVTNRVASFDSIISDVTGSGLWSIAAIFLVIAVFYRRLMSIFYIGLPLIVGFLLTFALTKLHLGGLNMVTIFLVLILFGLGIDFGIHNLARYDEVRRHGGDMRRALRTIYSKTGHASLLAGVTTVTGFYSLMLTNFKAFYEFGFIAGSGIVLTLFSMYVFFPALMVFAEKIKLYRISKRANVSTETKQRPFPGAVPIMIVGTVCTVLAVIVAPTIQFEDNFGNLKTKMPEISKINDKIKQVFPLNTDQAVIFVDNLGDVSALVDELERIRLDRSEEDATISKVRSIYTVVPKSEDQQERLESIESIQVKLMEAKRLLEDFSDKDDPRIKEIEEALRYFGVSRLTAEDLPSPIQRVFTGVPGSGGYLVYVYNKKGMSNLKNAQAFVNDIRTVEANGKTFYPATEAMIFVDMLNLMRADAGRAVIFVLLAVSIVLVIAFRNIKHTIIVITPVVVGVIWMLGLMVVLGIKLNIFNMVVLPTVLGIGIDNGIHIFHRYQEEGGRVRHVIRTTGGAAFLTTLTTMLGFAGTLAASNQGLQSLGLVACLGLGCCMISSLTVFPALLQLVENRNKAQHDASSYPESAISGGEGAAPT